MIRRAASWAIHFLSILINPNRLHVCRFEPSCGAYARRAVIEWGVGRGAWLGAKRFLKCHPWGGSGYDPLPATSER